MKPQRERTAFLTAGETFSRFLCHSLSHRDGAACLTVHSTFDSVINLELTVSPVPAGFPDTLFSLGCSGTPINPAMATVETASDFSWRRAGIQDGREVFFYSGFVLIGTIQIEIPPSLPVWQGIKEADLKNLNVDPPSVIAERIRRGKELFLHPLSPRIVKDDPLSDAFIRAAGIMEDWAKISLGSGSVTLPQQETAGLVGLGPGLTPSGDDYLSGLLLSLHFISSLTEHRADKGSRFLAVLRQAVLENLNKTNRISRHFLRYSMEGLWGKTEEDFMIALAADGGSYIKAGEILASRGASSGRDEIRGILTGFSFGIQEGLFDSPGASKCL
jgi:hypothetical protein